MAKGIQIVGKVAKFKMSIQGGDLPKNFKATIDTEIDFTGATNEQLYECCASGQSARVQLQGQLRKESVAKLTDLGMSGLKVKFTDILSGPPQKSARDLIMEMSKEDFITLMTEDYDLSIERAETMYNLKHGIKSE